jgi:hypothetical protein
MMKTRVAILTAVFLLAGSFPASPDRGSTPGVQPRGAPATYDVELWTDGPFSQFDNPGCSSGRDRLTGSLTGNEPATANDRVDYRGTLQRTTRIAFCDLKPLPSGESAMCSANLIGQGNFDVVLTIYPEDRRGGYMQAVGVQVDTSGVSGNCDAGDMAQLQNDYGTGDTAGSPNGQHIEDEFSTDPPFYANGVIRLPIGTYPPDSRLGGWTLRVLRKHP